MINRKVDLFTIAFGSCFLYFMPAFFGYVMDPNDYLVKIPLLPKTYNTFSLVIVTICGFAFMSDQLIPKKTTKKRWSTDPSLILFIGSLICYAGVFMTIYRYGHLFFEDKNVLLAAQSEDTDRWSLFWSYGEVFLITFAIIFKRKYFFILGMIALVVDVYYGGHRSRAAFIILIYIIYIFSKNEPLRLLPHLLKLKNILWTIGLLLLTAFFFIFKVSINLLKQGRSADLWNLIKSNDDFLSNAFVFSEPSIVQSNLNEAFRRNLRTDPLNWIDILDVTLPITRFLNIKSEAIYFNQKIVFPSVEWGTANNPWAFYWSSGGDLLLYTYIFLFGFIIFIGNYLIQTTVGIIQVFWMFFFVVFVFFSHRNDLMFQLVMQKRVIIFFGIILTSTLFLNKFLNIKATNRNA